MKKFLVIIIVLACIVGVASALTYDQDNYVKNRMSIMSGTGNDPLYNFIGEVDDIFTGAKVEVVTSTNAITIAEAGKVFVLNSVTEFASTLPSAATSAGITYRFIIGAAPAGASYTIVTDSSENLIYGMVLEAETDTSNDGPVAQEEDTITFVQSIAVIGDWVEVTCDGTNWYISGMTAADGAVTLTQAS